MENKNSTKQLIALDASNGDREFIPISPKPFRRLGERMDELKRQAKRYAKQHVEMAIIEVGDPVFPETIKKLLKRIIERTYIVAYKKGVVDAVEKFE